MLSFEDITRVFSYELEGKFCVEIQFLVKGYPKYQSCWMGKMPNKADTKKEVYWYGLMTDGSEAYDYDNFRDFSSALVFSGKSLKEIWQNVEVLSIDGCGSTDRLEVYRI